MAVMSDGKDASFGHGANREGEREQPAIRRRVLAAAGVQRDFRRGLGNGFGGIPAEGEE